MNRWARRAVPAAVAILVAAGLVYGFWPRPVEVDLGEVTVGPMRVTVNEEGKTRVRERYVVSAPMSGSMLRVHLKAGDPVIAGRTILAIVEPVDPNLLNAREKAEAEARIGAAEAAKEQAEARVRAAENEYNLAAADLARVRDEYAKGATSATVLQTAEAREQVRAQDWRAARFAASVAAYEVKLARAAFRRPDPKSVLPPEDARLDVIAPVSGKVLRVFRESAGVVAPGTEILEIGDPVDLEVVIEVLSTDAVRIAAGQRVVIERWGGPEPLTARVRRVEPSAFLKVSALGVEEQRVNVLADFIDPPENRPTLGDAYRVEARVVVWEGAEVRKVPAGALFRAPGGEWAVFAVRDGRARLTPVVVGRSNGAEAEVLDGLSPGDQVVLHPSDRVTDGARVTGR